MCGIIGYIGKSDIELLFNGLKMLQSRGYDSCGCATIIENMFKVHKYANTEKSSAFDLLHNYKKDFNGGKSYILHNRWSTCGAKTDENAHPHIDMNNKYALVHNGIIENYVVLKNMLINNNYTFKSQTDSEVIVNLISYNYNIYLDTVKAIEETIKEIEGTYALCILSLDEPDKLYCVRNGSPLLLSHNNNFAMVVSEVSGFYNKVDEYICLEKDDLCIISYKNDKINIECKYNYTPRHIQQKNDTLTPFPYPYWTIKEIIDQISCSDKAIENRIQDNLNVRLVELELIKYKLYDVTNIILLGCGTSLHACMEGSFFFKELCDFYTVQYFDGAEFTLKDIPKIGKTVVIMVSQSGETKDLHRCFDIIKQNNCITLGIINAVDSMIARDVDAVIYLNAGREHAVASTKAFTSQVIVLSLVSIWFAQNKNISKDLRKKYINSLRNISNDIQEAINNNKHIAKTIARYLNDHNSMFILGKGLCEPSAKEGSLKIKEIGYIHAESYSSSSLKHGPYSLIVPSLPVILLTPNDEHFTKNNSVADEILARYGYLIGISDITLSDKYNERLYVPHNDVLKGILVVIPMQLIAYELALVKNNNPDFPRNLAKCVTTD